MRSSHDTANPRLVEVLTSEAPSAIHWLEEFGVEFTRSNGGYRLARCGGATRTAAAPGRRSHRACDHEGACARRTKRAPASSFHTTRSAPRAARGRLARFVRDEGRCRRRSTPAPSCSPPAAAALPRPRHAASSPPTIRTPPARSREIALEAGCRGARPRRVAVPPERRRLAGDDAGLLDPGDDARLRRRAAQRRRRGVHRLARAARRGFAGDLRRGRGGPRASTPEAAGRRSGSTRRGSRPRTPRSRFRTCFAATAARASTLSRSRSTRIPSSTIRTVGS